MEFPGCGIKSGYFLAALSFVSLRPGKSWVGTRLVCWVPEQELLPPKTLTKVPYLCPLLFLPFWPHLTVIPRTPWAWQGVFMSAHP